ncbi:glycerol-3-phosphate acyltransferase, partial [Streptococcus sp. DD11]|uniref:glycerol-3-phosphate acyltransferase n=1 Tax=Streptococcus sp. DD11 TaxID=1777879 RepID=UPI0019D1F859
PLVFGLLAVIGHTFPVFAGFKGGKAVATSAGVVLGFSPAFFVYLIAVFVSTLYLGSMISLASVVSAALAILSALIFPAFGFLLPGYDPFFTLIIITLALIIIVRHRDNIQRIKQKKENLIPWGLNLTHQEPEKK